MGLQPAALRRRFRPRQVILTVALLVLCSAAINLVDGKSQALVAKPAQQDATDAPLLLEQLSDAEIAALVSPLSDPDYVPEELLGMILFRSDMGPDDVFAFDPDTKKVFMVSAPWVHKCAEDREKFSASREYQAFVKQVMAWDVYHIEEQPEDIEIAGHYPQFQIHYYNHVFQAERPLTHFGLNTVPTQTGDAWDPAWSPTDDLIAMTANEDGDDNIFVVRKGEWPATQLTEGRQNRAWDKHPTWSPDGAQIVFSSSRTGQRRLWIMDANGDNQRQLSDDGYAAWDPTWVKYVGRDGCPGLPPDTTSASQDTTSTSDQGVVNHNANLRAGPGTDSAIVGSATTGTSVVISETNQAADWLQLDSGEWVAAFLVDRGDTQVDDGALAVARSVRSSAPATGLDLAANVDPDQLHAYVDTVKEPVDAIFVAVDEATVLYDDPRLADPRWLAAVTSQFISLRTAYKQVVATEAPEPLEDFHAQLIDATRHCYDATFKVGEAIDIALYGEPPNARDDHYRVSEGGSITIALLDNDSDPEGDPIRVSDVSDPANGRLTLRADGAATYVTDASYCGRDRFTYSVADSTGGVDAASVTVEVVCEDEGAVIEGRVSGIDGGEDSATRRDPMKEAASLVLACEEGVDRLGEIVDSILVD